MNRILVFLICLFMSGQAHSQLPAVSNKELLERVKGLNTVPDVMRIVDSFYRDKLLRKEFDRDYKKWHRWATEMLRTAGPGGVFGDINQYRIDAWKKESTDEPVPNTTITNWSFTAPYFSSYPGTPGGFNGIGRCDRIAFHPTDPQTVFIGTPMGGLWKTTNGGSSWTALTSYLPVQGVSGIVVDKNNPNIIYIATGNADDVFFASPSPNAYTSAGVFKTTDGGGTWSQLPLPWADTLGTSIYQMEFSSRSPQVLLLATSRGLYRTLNDGVNWTTQLFGKIDDVKFVPGTDTVYVSLPGPLPLRRSTNRGLSFNPVSFNMTAPVTPIDSIPNRTALAVSNTPVTPGGFENVYLFCGPVFGNGDCNGLFKMMPGNFMQRVRRNPNMFGAATGGGDNFDQSGYDICAAVHPTNSNIMAVGGACVYRTTDAGVTMPQATFYSEDQTPTDYTKYIHPDIHGMAFNPLDNSLYAATDGGVYRSTNNGVNWTNISYGITTSMFYEISGFEGNINTLMGSLQDNGIKYRETATNDMPHMACCDGFNNHISPTQSNRAYGSGNGWFYRYDNLPGTSGADVSPQLGGGAWSWRMNSDPADGNYIYASHHIMDSIWISSNAGASWFWRRQANGNRAIVTCPSNVNRAYVCGSFPIWDFNTTTLKRTDDKGNFWTANLLLNPGLPPLSVAAVLDVEVNPLNSLEVWITYSGLVAGSKVYFSNNGGVSWSNMSFNLPNVPVNSIAVDDGNFVYVGTDYGVYYKEPGSTTWIHFSNGLPRVPVKDLYLNRTFNVLYAGTYGRGIYRANAYDGVCSTFMVLSGVQAGQSVNEANVIWSTQDVTGSAITYVTYKASDSIKLLNGFIATDSIREFKAMLAPCGTGYPPLRNVGDSTSLDPRKFTLPVSATSQYPFSTVRVKNFDKSSAPSLEVQVFQEGMIEVRVSNREGNPVANWHKQFLKPGTYSFSVKDPLLPVNSHYIHLIHNGMEVHFQEW